ncbi:MAG: hypothetical protein M1834_002866 [Cirrosporium novae-zelandiae]|nr:MAG: hypothetical protein M1834_002866 [Cirrosporium novae-zelandiae]
MATTQDAFQQIVADGTAYPSTIGSRSDHPVARLNIVNQTGAISTNKFFANFFLGTQGQATFTHPYSVTWAKGSGNAQSWGLAISHIDASQKALGPQQTNIPGSPVQYYINPIGIQSMILSAIELGSSTVLTTDTIQASSCNVNLQSTSGSGKKITFPLVQGMGFITAIYNGLQPAVQSSVFFRSVVSVGTAKSGVYKYRITLEDSKSWLMYATPTNGADPGFTLVNNTLIQGTSNWYGTIQVTKNPAGTSAETTFDASAGAYPTTANVTGSVTGSTGTYKFSWTKGGLTSSSLLMYALPHHIKSITSPSFNTSIQLQTTTKGNATAIVGDSWTLQESNLPTNMSFAPWRPSSTIGTALSAAAISAINSAASSEVTQDMNAQSNLDSMYFSGKALAKFAMMIYAIHDLAQNPSLATTGLSNLKTAFSRFVNNTQTYPLVYDSAWKGIVSSGTYTTGNSGLDFGNTYYNDHHFHYGYFVYAAAVIGYLDSTWLSANKAWVNTLVRDFATPVKTDPLFPFSRSFDWYHGHSFAKGLFESGDSKDEESSSEDAFSSYAIKMWGNVIGDKSMEARGNLMLAITARSLQNYFLMESTNTNQPANFIGNKVTGILFENKCDHTTYFGTNLEYIQGIHMIPLNPSSTLTRTTNFVTEEWNTYFASSAVDPAANVTGGWKGLLYANLAIIDPKSAWNFFSQSNFDSSWLDGGASRTWYLAWCAALGGA